MDRSLSESSSTDDLSFTEDGIYRTIFEQAVRPRAVVEADGTVVEVNNAFMNWRDVPRDQVIDQPIWEAAPTVLQDRLALEFPSPQVKRGKNGSNPPKHYVPSPSGPSNVKSLCILTSLVETRQSEDRFLLEYVHGEDGVLEPMSEGKEAELDNHSRAETEFPMDSGHPS